MKVFYDERQVVEGIDSFSPSAGKARQVVASWQASGFPIECMPYQPLALEDLALAHDRAYVEAVLAGRRRNGFGNTDMAVARSLLYTTGSMYAAARHAAVHRESCCSPTSGFHHAGWDHAGGFCTFNGLVIAICKLRVDGNAHRVGILDLDAHYGNGTDEIISKLGLEGVEHYTFGIAPLAERDTADQWLEELPGVLQRFDGCDVVLYQAGADPHVDDPLGGVLTTAQMLTRDRLVFSTFASADMPVAWNLAGGYQTPLRRVLDLHDNTARAFVEVHTSPVPR